jgi:two-component system phosphate regulon sensor histidine kinase PhoR
VASRLEEGETVPEAAYSTILFPAGFTESHGRLLLWFPGYRTHLLRSILPELFLNLFFVLIIGACFRFAMKTLRRQREFAGRLTDFINNMTHEFKTPLSTIALSTEALARPDVVGDRSKVEMYGGIIADEHRRMRSQVDRILELAALEEGEFEFRRERLDLHEVVARAAANSGLRVRERGGTVATDLRAADHAIRGDAMHIGNVVNSVLDNAEKYSPGTPSIRVATYNADGCVVVSIADRGIGIAAEHLPNIFEKYFRVPTNNLHDVKGFGIGLSYVRLVVERHGGTVRAQSSRSSPGRGTTIELKFPVDDGR